MMLMYIVMLDEDVLSVMQKLVSVNSHYFNFFFVHSTELSKRQQKSCTHLYDMYDMYVHDYFPLHLIVLNRLLKALLVHL